MTNENRAASVPNLEPLASTSSDDFLHKYQTAELTMPEWLKQPILRIPPNHDTYGWACAVSDCQAALPTKSLLSLCSIHVERYRTRSTGTTYSEFISAAKPLSAQSIGKALVRNGHCVICGEAREARDSSPYCRTHHDTLTRAKSNGNSEQAWLLAQAPLEKFGPCGVPKCRHDGAIRDGSIDGLSLCELHYHQYSRFRKRTKSQQAVEVWNLYCRSNAAHESTSSIQEIRGTVDLRNHPEPMQQQLRYILHRYSRTDSRSRWRPVTIQRCLDFLAEAGIANLSNAEIIPALSRLQPHAEIRRVVQQFPSLARPLIETESSTKESGIFDPAIVGGNYFSVNGAVKNGTTSFDLTSTSQRWLRDALWNQLKSFSLLPDGKRPSIASVYLQIGGSALFSRLLRTLRTDNGDYPERLTAADAESVGNEFHSWLQEGTPVVPDRVKSGEFSALTPHTHRIYLAAMRSLLSRSHDSGQVPESLGRFIGNLPKIPSPPRTHRPRPIDNATLHSLMDPLNLAELDQLDVGDCGLSDIWLTHLLQGGRIGETLNLRIGAVGLIGNQQPYFWRDITKSGQLDYGMPCHPVVYERLLLRREKTLKLLKERYHDELAEIDAAKRLTVLREWEASMPLFPSRIKNLDHTVAYQYSSFRKLWTQWVASLNIEGLTTHRTRATMATTLLNNGAPAELVRQVLGHFSFDSLAHYARYNDSNVVEQLRRVWAAGPGMPIAGQVLLSENISTAFEDSNSFSPIDLSAIPSEHGLCSYGPVVGGKDCPWGLQCASNPSNVCEHFIVTGADLSYWQRKMQAAYTLAEGVESEDVREFIYSQWEEWEVVLSNLRKALKESNLLEAAEQVSIRLPNSSYLHALYTTGWSYLTLASDNPRDETV